MMNVDDRWNFIQKLVNPARIELDDTEKATVLQTRLIILSMNDMLVSHGHYKTDPDIRQLDDAISSLDAVITRYSIDKFSESNIT